MTIDWLSRENIILLNPRMPIEDKNKLLSALQGMKGLQNHFFITSSGSSGQLKWIALSKQAVLASASAVNEHLQSSAQDIWLNPLPIFHVGGLGIQARAFVSGAKSIPFERTRWDPHQFVKSISKNNVTLTSLVPAQLFDLVANGLSAPTSLRAIIIGGGALSEKLYLDGIALGWNLLPSYGLTECSSQVATALIDSWQHKRYPLLQQLPHVTLAVDPNRFLMIQSRSLLTASIHCTDQGCRWHDPKQHGWLTTEDICTFNEGMVASIHRNADFIKIGGESVDLLRLEKILDEIKLKTKVKADVALLEMPDERLGHVIHLAVATTEGEVVNGIVDAFKKSVMPYEQIRHIHLVDAIPRSPLKKVLKKQLRELLILLG